MRRLISAIFISLLVCLTGCRTSKSVESTLIKTDTIYQQSIKLQRYDSIVYVHDSIMQTEAIYVTLDSAGKEIKRIEYHNKDHYNTANTATNNLSEQKDTSKVSSNTESKVVKKTVTTNILTTFQKIEIWLGRILFILFILLIILYLSRNKLNFLKKLF